MIRDDDDAIARAAAVTQAPTRGVPAAAPAPAAAAPLSRRRRTLVWVLVVLASVVAVLSTLTTWVQRQMLDDSAWHKASVQIIQDPAVRNALSTEIVNELYSNVNVAQQLEKLFPKSLKPLAGPAAAALQEPATKAVEFMFSQPRFQQLFVQASDLAHERLVNVLENKTGFGISTGNGVVTLNITVLLKQLGAALGVPTGALDRLPANAGTITIMKSDQLALAQEGVRTVKVLSPWLLVLVFVLYGAALYLARGMRRKTLAHIGWGLVIVGLVLLVARKVLGNYVVNSLTLSQYRLPSQHIWLYATAILGQIGLEVILYGLVTVAGALVAGPSRPATELRHVLAPVLNTRPELTWGTAAFVYLLVVLWGGTHALQTWWGILLLGALFAAGIVALRKQTLAEFPAAGLDPSGHTMGARVAASVSGAAHRVTASARQHEPHRHASGGRSTAEELSQLAALRAQGAISEAEFEQAKKIALTT